MEYGNNSSTPEKFADVRAAYKEIFESAERVKKGKDGKEITEKSKVECVKRKRVKK